MPDRVTATATIMSIDAPDVPCDRLRQLIDERGGRVVPTADGIVAGFDAASLAATAATAVQADVARTWPEADLRVALAAGDVIWEGNECFGPPLVAAGRLCAAAAPGQALMTQTARALAGDVAGLVFEHLGPIAVPGSSTAIDAFALAPIQPAAASAASPSPPLPLALAGTSGHPFVGRADALGALTAAWSDASRSTGRLVLLGGEAGAGKTRLAAEFARRVHAEGAAVLYGGCDDDLALPFQPWVQAVDAILPDLIAADDWLTVDLAPLSSLLVNIDRFVPPGSAAVSPDPETERYRRYGAFSRLLVATAARWPTLVVLDDLHWAGPQTLALLRHLPRAGLPRGVVLLATYRDTGDEITDQLALCLADLRRVDGARRLHLGGLNAAEVEQLVVSAAGGAVSDDVRDVSRILIERTDGNAFYVGELWRHLVAAGAVVEHDGRYAIRSEAPAREVPDSVREVVEARLARLSPSARRVLETAAVAGQRIESAVLVHALQLTPHQDRHAAALATDELLGTGLLCLDDGPPVTYRFAHAIVRDTVEASIAAPLKRQLHLAVGESMEAIHVGDRRPVLAELARHFVAAVPAGRIERAANYAQQAAAQAVRAAAYEEAAAHVRAVLDLDVAPSDRAELLLQLGAALLRSGFYTDSQHAFGEAFELAAAGGQIDVATDAAIGHESAWHYPGLWGEQAVELVGRALELAGDAEPAMRARLRASYGRALAVAGRRGEGLAVAESAQADALALDDPQSLAVALQAIMMSTDDPELQLDLAAELDDVAVRLDDSWSAAYATANSFRGLVQLGRLEEARQALGRLRRVSASGRFFTYQFMSEAFEAILALAVGDHDAAEAAVERGHELAVANDSPFGEGVYGLQMFSVRRAQGRLAEVAPTLRLLVARAEVAPMWRPGLAALYAELGLLDEAAEVFNSLAPDRFAAVPRDGIWPACLTFMAETGLAVGGPADVEVLYELLLPHRGRNLLAGFTTCYGPADRLLGALAARLGRDDDADAHFAVALELANRSGSPVWVAEIERSRAPGRTPGPPPRPNRLSEREVEVLRCVASGMSNREIGDELFISQNTVANHVRSILQKTGCANRTEAASYAVRRGLSEPYVNAP